MAKGIALLGSTGSIGTQALDVISRYPGHFTVEVLTAGSNIELLVEQTKKFRPGSVVIASTENYKALKEGLWNIPVKIYSGNEALEHVVTESGIDMVIASMVGYSGLRPTLSAINAGKDIALANKETMVVAGELISRAAEHSGSKIIPVDSEHSAILQCMAGENKDSVEKITLTASGGPFLNHTAEALKNVTPADALRHPNWEMGSKITIDSATLMNKGLEVIEAKWLFNLEPDQIDVIVHPQSVIHSFVHFKDGSVKAQLGMPDMRVPILYALTWPERILSDLPRMNFNDCNNFTFFKPDTGRFRNLELACRALRTGGNMPCILNAANEVAVEFFLNGRIKFLQMPEIVEYAMSSTGFYDNISMELLEATDVDARAAAKEYINKIN